MIRNRQNLSLLIFLRERKRINFSFCEKLEEDANLNMEKF